MSISGVQGQMLQVTVVECTQLKNTEDIKRQDSYVCIEYGSTKFRTLTCQDGGKDPVFKEKFMFSLIEGLKEINVVVWNSNPISYDSFIGSTRVQLEHVISGGYSDRSWPLQTKTGRFAGEVKLIMHCDKANKSAPPSYTSPYTPPPYTAMPTHPNSASQPPIPYSTHPQVAHSYPPPSPGPSMYPPPPYAVSPYMPPSYASSYSPPGFYGMYNQPPC